ncbi:hypothetical protein [Dactylosporangium roseum]
MKVSWLGAGAVVHSGDEPSSGAAQLVVSPHGSAECAVVISSHTVKLLPAMIEELAEVLANGLPRGFSAMRFVAWDGACANKERPAAAHMISMRLGIDVIAAAGPLLGVPGGSLFAPEGRGEHRPGGFWRFRPGDQPVRVGWRFPAPQWEADLSTELPELPGDLVLDQIPAGLWLHRRRVGSVTDLAYSVPTDDAHPALILSHPNEEPLHRDEVAQAVAAIPALAVDKCVFTPYGQQPIADGPVGPVVADVLGRSVHVRTGLPLCAPAGQRAVVTIDRKCLPRWRTFARELWHAPRTGAPRPVDWINPCPDLLDTPAGAATFSLGSGWVLEVVQAGIWIRPEHLNDPADWIRGLPVDVDRCAIIMGAPHAAELPPPGHLIADVLEKLPIDARKRSYLAVPRGAAPNVFVFATALIDSLPEASEVELLTPTATPPATALPAFPPSTTTTGSFPAVQQSPASPGLPGSSPSGLSSGLPSGLSSGLPSGPSSGLSPDSSRPVGRARRHGDVNGPYLVDGRPANGHPSGAHPTVPRSAAYEERNGYDRRFEGQRPIDEPRPSFEDTRSLDGSPAGSFEPQRPYEEPRTGGFAAQPEDGYRSSRTSSFPPAPPAPPIEPGTTSFAPLSPNGAHRPTNGQPRHSGARPDPRGEDRPDGWLDGRPEGRADGRADGRLNGRDDRSEMLPGGRSEMPPGGRSGDATTAFQVPGPNGNRGLGPNGQGHAGPGHAGQGHAGPVHAGPVHAGPVHGGPNHGGPSHAGPGFAGSSHTGPGQVGPGQVGPGQVGPGYAAPGHAGSGHAGSGHAAPGHVGPGFDGPDRADRGGHSNGHANGHSQHGPANGHVNGRGDGHAGMHPDLHVAPPRTFHRDAQPLPPNGPAQPGYAFDAPNHDEYHFDVPAPPSRHHDEATGRMPGQRMAVHDEASVDDRLSGAEETSSINTGREIRSHSKKGKTTRADDKTSTQELDRLLGFFDEIRRAKAWDEDPNSPEEQAARRAAAGQPPAGRRRARH